MTDKRPIDRSRESAKTMEVGTLEEGAVKEMIPIGSTLYVVKERAIYIIKLADQIDPQRSNANIPDTQQKFASEGYDSDRVCRILLTGRELFNKSYLLPEIDCERGLSICTRLLQEVLAMHEAAISLRETEETAARSIKASRGNLVLGAIPDIFTRAKSFIHRAEHAAQILYALCGLFYVKDLEVKGRWFDGVTELLREKYGAADDFYEFSAKATKFCKFLRNARHCVEHEKPYQRIVVNDFGLLASGQIMPPTIEVVHAETPEPTVPLLIFMEQMTESVVNVAESLIAFLCAKHVRSVGGLPAQVGEIPEDQRDNKKVRFGYAVWLGDQLVRAS